MTGLTWDRPDKRHRVRCSLLILGEDGLLLAKHWDPSFFPRPYWTLPGGSLERGESLVDAAMREAREETGLDVDIEKLVYIRQLSSPQHDLSQVELLFLVTRFRGRVSLDGLEPNERESLTELRWFNEVAMSTAREDVVPQVLQHRFWTDVKAGFPETVILAPEGPG